MREFISLSEYLFKSFLLILALVVTIYSYGQEDTQIDKEVVTFAKNPESAAMSKHIDIPASTYNGVVSFSIPIYTIEVEGYQVPISLNYSTTGVKVGEVSSIVGLGWNLSLGGISLSKQVIGSPDLMTRPVIRDVNILENDYILEHDLADITNGYVSSNSTEVLETPRDMEPDIFSYGTLNGSGHFIFHSTENIGIPLPYNQTKIWYHNNDDYIKIKDEQGVEYSFSKSIFTKYDNLCQSHININLSHNNSDYSIRKVEFPNGSELLFNTENNITNYTYYTSVSMTVKKNYKPYNANINPNPEPLNFKCFNTSEVSLNLLKEIVFDSGKVKIIYSDENEREDILGAKFIKQIIVINNYGEIIRDFKLNYDYFESPQNDGRSDFIPNSSLKSGIFKRLKLVGVTNNLSQEKYLLKYYGDDSNLQLPHRLSLEQDVWGVYNGKFPENKIYGEFTSIGTSKYRVESAEGGYIERVLMGSDKSPDINYGLIGNLKEIHYPTGGYTKINYESDDYFTPQNVEYEYESYTTDRISNNNNNYPQSINFSINGNGVYEAYLNCYKDGESSNGNPLDGPNIGMPGSGFGDAVIRLTGSGINESVDCPSAKPIYLSPGNYTLEIYNDTLPPMGEEIETYFADLNYITETEIIIDNNNKKIGTLRVSKIENYENATDAYPTLKKRFYYNDLNGNSTGVNHGDQDLRSFSRQQYPISVSDSWPIYADILNFSSIPGRELNLISGKPVGYSSVIEEVVSDNETYRIKYDFHNEIDLFNSEYDPYDPINISWRNPSPNLRGKPKKTTYYDSEHKVVKMEEYYYNTDPYFNNQYELYPLGTNYSQVLMIGLKIDRKSTVCITDCISQHNYKMFSIVNNWIQDVQRKVVEYSNGQETISINNYTNYSTENPTHPYPISHYTTNSLGEVLKTEYKYPQDLTSNYEQSSMMQELVDRNIISTPIITKSFNDGTVTSERRTWYGDYHGNILPSSIYAKRGEMNPNIDLDDRKITYDLYDPKGNLMQYTLENGTPVSIVWGYNGQYPIAKIEGINYGVIQTLANNLINASNQGNLSESHFESLRNVNGAIVTGYIYKPLIGVTKIIHPNGQQEIYEYDAAGRLERIKDHEGKILKEVEYHYQNQP